MKRIFDIVVSIISILMLLPFFILVAISIKIESRGPIFFKQHRVGYLGQKFFVYKFRSMVDKSEELGPYYTVDNDQRVTKVGKFIRRTSLDELPQLLNVLKGDMSIVGPRPDVPIQKSQYTAEEWDRRNSVRPGITGLHQCTLRSSGTQKQRIKSDLEYVDRASFLLDMKIILMTIKQIAVKGGN
jgi:lipopolysaccharide/colanic/teichoic acid biosynthesis glycosyltransferase